jgi:hypothetical protein
MERLSTRTGSILRGTVLFWVFETSRAGFDSAILEPRKARIYTEALARILFRVILCVPWLKGFWVASSNEMGILNGVISCL